MFTVYVGLVFRSKYVQFPVICSLQYSVNINTVEVDPHSDLPHICIVKPKNTEAKDGGNWRPVPVPFRCFCPRGETRGRKQPRTQGWAARSARKFPFFTSI